MRRLVTALLVGGLLGVGLASGAPELRAQAGQERLVLSPEVRARAASVPFGPGERLEYQVKLGVFSVGEGSLEVEGLDTVRGRLTYRAAMVIEGGIPLARVQDRFETWFDVESLVSRRFIQRIREVRYRSFRHYEIYPEERRWERADREEEDTLPTMLPLDDISFVYFVRTLPLDVGAEYRFDRYFKASGNPVVIRVVRRDTVDVPAGRFATLVVRPTIQTKGLFGEGGEAELHFSDDERRILVQLRSKVPLVGSLTLSLRTVREGVPLRPRGRREGAAPGVPPGPARAPPPPSSLRSGEGGS